MYATDSYALAAVKCPVDVEVYDESGNLVARTTTDTFTVVDDETGEEYSYTVSVVDEEATTLEAFVLGASKYIKLPDTQQCSLKITANEAFEANDTMTYTVTNYQDGKEAGSVTYETIELSADSSFSATLKTSDNEIEACTLFDGTQELEPTRVEKVDASTHIVSDLNVERDGARYNVSGTLSAAMPAALLCAVYDEDGQMLSVASQSFEAAGDDLTISVSPDASDEDAVMKVFVVDELCNPLDVLLEVYL